MIILDSGASSEKSNDKAILISFFNSLLINLFQADLLSPNWSRRFSRFIKELPCDPFKINFADSPKTVPNGLIVKIYSSLGFIGLIGQEIGPLIFLSKVEFLDHNIFPFFEIVISLRQKKDSLLRKISSKLVSEEKISEELAINSAKEGFEEVERLLVNHTEAV